MRKTKQIIAGVAVLAIVFFWYWTTPVSHFPGTVKIWDRNHILLYESDSSVGKKNPVEFEAFPRSLIDATVAAEDESFWTNPGIDVFAMARSAWLNLTRRKIVSGASTITQQVARMSMTSPFQHSSPNIIRKVREVLMALRLQATHSKKEIMTTYLNESYYGNMTYGAAAAARTFFDKDVSALSLPESALLAGILSAPGSREPYANFSAAKARQEQVLDLMVKNELLKQSEAESAKAEVLSLGSSDTELLAPHFVHFILDELRSLPVYQPVGINVYTTFDYPTYTLGVDIARIWVRKLEQEHDLSNASLVLIENSTGEIITMLGGIDYFDATNSGAVNIATALRQPGSTLKPITYAAAFMQGYTPATVIYDIPTVYKTKKGEGYAPNNYDGRFHGLVLAREALASSLNLPAVEMMHRIGVTSFLTQAKDLGITTFNQEDRYDLSLTLGGGEVTLLDLTNVYAGFARGGVYLPPYAIEKVTTDTGRVIFTHQKTRGIPVLGKTGAQISYLISDILSDPHARQLGFYEKNPLVLSHPAAVKTGTTTDWHDNWTVGYTPSYTVGVWVGNNDNHAMKNITGVVGAAPIWNQFLEEFLKGKPVEQFTDPGGIITIEICKLTGELPDDLCPETISEKFITGTEPQKVTTLYKKVLVDTRNNLLADESCPSSVIKERILIEYPPEVYSWAVTNNQEVIPRSYSPLCGENQTVPSPSFIQLVYPRPLTVFQDASDLVQNQKIVFEVHVSSSIRSVTWYIDQKPVGVSDSFPFSFSWSPTVGDHVVHAVGVGDELIEQTSEKVKFSVTPFGSH